MAEAIVKSQSPSLIKEMAKEYGLEENKFYKTIVDTIFPTPKQGQAPPSPEQVAAFLVVAHHYKLNPFTREIYAFPKQGGGIVPIVGIDGWIATVQRREEYDGHEFVELMSDDKKLIAVTCKIWRKDRSRSTEMTEYLHECKRSTDPWTQWPSRMLHHKAFIQAARYAFGLTGIYDEDEGERIAAADSVIAISPIRETRRASEKPQDTTSQPDSTQDAPAASSAQESTGTDGSGSSEAIPGPEKASKADIKEFWSNCMVKLGWSQVNTKRFIKDNFNMETLEGVSKETLATIYSDMAQAKE